MAVYSNILQIRETGFTSRGPPVCNIAAFKRPILKTVVEPSFIPIQRSSKLQYTNVLSTIPISRLNGFLRLIFKCDIVHLFLKSVEKDDL
jgi:hypothetical protein